MKKSSACLIGFVLCLAAPFAVAQSPNNLLTGNGLTYCVANYIQERIQNIATLRAMPIIIGGQLASTSGYYAAGDGGGSSYVGSTTNCSLNNGAGDGGSQIRPAGSGCWLLVKQNSYSASQWGAKSDGVTDDTAAVQAAINYALTNVTNAAEVSVSGPTLVTASLIVNRPVNTHNNVFHIRGNGEGAGFVSNGAINIFDTSLATSGRPVSERLAFQNVTFKTDSPLTAAYAMSPKFLRVECEDCSFINIKALTATAANYLQQWSFKGGYATGWNGTFFGFSTAHAGSGTAYAISVSGMDFEVGTSLGNGFDFGTLNVGNFRDNIFESGGAFYYSAGASAVNITGNYFEANGSADIQFADNSVGGVTSGVVYEGNSHRTVSVAWPVILGATMGKGAGNYSTGALYDDTSTQVGAFRSSGDYVAGALNASGSDMSVVATGLLPRTSGITANPGGGQSGAVLLTASLNQVVTCGAGGADSVKLPPALSGSIGEQVIIENACIYAIKVFPSGTDQINYQGSSNGVTQASGGNVTIYYNDAPGNWVSK